MSVTVRIARPDEHELLGEIVVTAYRSLPGFDEPDYEPELREIDRRAREAVVLAAIDGDTGAAIGCATYVPGPESPWAELLGPGEAAIRMLAVDPAARRKGAGTALAAACIARARLEERQRVVLHSLPIMADAQRIYARLGFRRETARDWEPVAGIFLMCFVLDLAVAPPGEAPGSEARAGRTRPHAGAGLHALLGPNRTARFRRPGRRSFVGRRATGALLAYRRLPKSRRRAKNRLMKSR